MSDIPEETTDQPEAPELLEGADWAWGEWIGFVRALWTGLCTVQGVSEINMEPAPVVPAAALYLPEGHCDRCVEAPYAVWVRFRRIDLVGAQQAQLFFFDELMAAPTIEALLAVCKTRIGAFMAKAMDKARSTIIRPGAGNGQKLGPGLPKNMRNLRFKP